MKKPRFRKITKRISIYSIPKRGCTTTSTNFEDVMLNVVDTFCNVYSDRKLLHDRIRFSNSIEWYCFTCKKKININVERLVKKSKPLNSKSFFCKDCKKYHRHADKLILVRYINSFYSNIKNIINTNSNLLELL